MESEWDSSYERLCESRFVYGLAFPDQDDAVGGAPQYSDLCCVALAIGRELLCPEIAIPRGDRSARASRVMVPKATVDENRPAVSPIGKVGRAGEAFHVATVVDAELAQRSGHPFLGFGAPLPHALHQGASSWIRR